MRLLLIAFLCFAAVGCVKLSRVYTGTLHSREVKLELAVYRGCIVTFGLPIAGLYETKDGRIEVKLPTGQVLEFEKRGRDLFCPDLFGAGPVLLHPQ